MRERKREKESAIYIYIYIQTHRVRDRNRERETDLEIGHELLDAHRRDHAVDLARHRARRRLVAVVLLIMGHDA